MDQSQRKIFLYMTTTLDGYLSGPNNELDWFHPPSDQELVDDIVAILSSADTWLMGYPTAPGLIAYWAAVPNNPSASPADRAIARALAPLHAVVLSNKPVNLDLKNSELALIRGDQDLVDLARRLRIQPGKDIYIPGGVRTGQKFSRLGLVDEYILMVYPVAIGKGQPLFTSRTRLHLKYTKSYASGVVQLRYQPIAGESV